ncbi:hypothetical protein MHYP_G00216190 [Metynnis hypsauchen]
MAIWVSRRSITEGLRDTDPVSVFKRLVKTRILIDFTFHSTNKDLGSFEQIWGGVHSLCSVKDGELNFEELLRLFIESVQAIMRNEGEEQFTVQEIYRLKKIVPRLKLGLQTDNEDGFETT